MSLNKSKASVFTFLGIKWNLPLLILFITTILLRGLAFETGQDYAHYYDYYYNVVRGYSDTWAEHAEAGYIVLVKFLSIFFANPKVFFVFSSIIIMGAMLKISQYFGKVAAPWIMFFWWMFMHGLSFNLYRQYYAISFILVSYIFFLDKKYILMILFSVLAVLFHTSALLPIFVISIVSLMKSQYSKWIPISCMVLTTVLSVVLLHFFASLSTLITVYYAANTGQVYEADALMESAYETSILIYPNMVVYIIWIWTGYKVFVYKKRLWSVYTVFALGLILIPITRQEILMRLCLYFNAFCPIVLGITFSTTYKKNLVFVFSIAYYFVYYCYQLYALGQEFPLSFKP